MTEKIEFDTHRFVKNLTACGFTEKQAEVLAAEQARLLARNLATKVDLEKFNASLKAELEKFNASLTAKLEKLNTAFRGDLEQVNADLGVRIETVKSDVARFKSDLLKWMLGAMSAQTALIAGLILGLVQFA